MTIDKIRKIFTVMIKVILIVGVIGGILCGVAFMGPSADALRHPTLYEDELHVWTLTSTVATVAVWLCSAFSALMLYGQIALIEMVHKILRIKEQEQSSSDSKNV